MEGSLPQMVKQPEEEPSPNDHGLHPEEVSVLTVIRKKDAALIEALPLNSVPAA
ncbi:MAG: hypothetical protein ACR2I2_23780 [Bryobacteraceae bacterium]